MAEKMDFSTETVSVSLIPPINCIGFYVKVQRY